MSDLLFGSSVVCPLPVDKKDKTGDGNGQRENRILLTQCPSPMHCWFHGNMGLIVINGGLV